MRLSATLLHAKWCAPLHAAHGDAETPRPLILVTLEAEDGSIGHGEAAPLQAYDGVSAEDVLGALDACRPALDHHHGWDHAAALASCSERTTLAPALAAIDLALWDLAGRLSEQPVWRLLGAATAPGVQLNATIGAEAPVQAAAAARAAVLAGFRCVKLKVGLGEDVARVSAVRAAVGPDVAIRIDANGAWPDAASALSALAGLEGFDIELCEEPVHGLSELAAVTRDTPIPIALDESAGTHDAFQLPVASAMCLKISRCGGINGLLRTHEQARRAGYDTYLSSTLDGPLGIAAALHAAAVAVPQRPSGLATLDRFDAPLPFQPVQGHLAPPSGPGLGDELVDWYAALRG
ncbi:MAG: hypothetical protein J2O48_00585 [Solirubrobacterales bacterium]|nr:hypothetical protein [Solirubrobacterales bacterium]